MWHETIYSTLYYMYLNIRKIFYNHYFLNLNVVEKELNSIKEALLEIMKVTCIKFVPHTNESDYVVFVEYKHPNQEKGSV